MFCHLPLLNAPKTDELKRNTSTFATPVEDIQSKLISRPNNDRPPSLLRRHETITFQACFFFFTSLPLQLVDSSKIAKMRELKKLTT